MQFNNRIVESYPELFEQGIAELDQARIDFGKKWGNYSELYTLAQGDIRRFNAIAKERLHTCLMYLAYEKEKAELESKLVKRNFK